MLKDDESGRGSRKGEKEKTGDNVSRRLLQWSKCAITRVRMPRMQGTLERKN